MLPEGQVAKACSKLSDGNLMVGRHPEAGEGKRTGDLTEDPLLPLPTMARQPLGTESAGSKRTPGSRRVATSASLVDDDRTIIHKTLAALGIPAGHCHFVDKGLNALPSHRPFVTLQIPLLCRVDHPFPKI